MASDPHAYALDGFRTVNRPHACVLVIFGASGDLTKRKLIPALYNLALEKLLPERFAVVGYARSAMTHENFRESMREAVKKFSRTGLKDETVWRQFANTLYYVPGTYEEHDGYQSLKDFVEGFDATPCSAPSIPNSAIFPPLRCSMRSSASRSRGSKT
jgi:glucose-6-phosphate 1-dehydrogenase